MKLCKIFYTFLLLISIIFQSSSQENHPKIGLVLSGGGAKGLAHIGVLKVLEEAGIQVDYIGGTSMGSIVGGLYAAGYSASEIEQIALSQDWDALILDKISRRNLPQEEKDIKSRYITELRLENGKLHLPTGIVSGQNITKLLTDLTLHVSDIDDFNKLPVPFLCVAMDVETGEPIILREGSLPEAMRSSMAIPSFFTPVEHEGKALIDGGMINNFPVQEVIDMGADIIIGVYVGHNPKSSDELISFTKILSQILFYYSNEQTDKNKELCNLLIEPEISEYHTGSFHDADSLIKRGEREARKFLAEFQKLTKKNHLKASSEKTAHKKDSVQISFIRYMGLKNVSQRLVHAKVKIENPGTIGVNQLDETIDQLYGTQYFENVSYRILPTDTGNILNIQFKEKSLKVLKVGLHYDSDLKSCIRLNSIFRNVGIKSSRLMLRLGLGDNIRYDFDYFINTFMKPDYNFRFRFRGDYIDIFDYDGGNIIQKFKLLNHTFDAIDQITWNNSYTFGGGIQFQYSKLHLQYGQNDYNWPDYDLANMFLFIDIDSYEKTAYAKRGIQLKTEYKLISNQKGIFKHLHVDQYLNGSLKAAIPVSKKISLIPQQYFAFVLSDSIPNNYLSTIGGVNLHKQPVVPFVGYRYTEIVDRNYFILRLDLQYEIFRNQFITLKSNIGKHSWSLKDLTDGQLIKGFGFSYGLNSITGPIEFTLMTRDFKKNTFVSFSMGYNF